MINKISFLGIISAFIFIVLFSSCDKFDSDQTIPAYIQIDSIKLENNPTLTDEGSLSNNITDAWVYINDQLLGVYEMPVTFPVLNEGKVEVTIMPGIELNGIAATRVPYPFYRQVILENVKLAPDSITKLNISTSYIDDTEFAWIEAFEFENISLDTTAKSKVGIHETSSDSPLTFEGLHSGIIELTSEDDFFECATYNAYILPQLGRPVFLEVNYKTSNVITIGVFEQTGSQIIQTPILNINTSEIWKKIYVNLTPTVSGSVHALDFKIFIGAIIDEGLDDSQILLDNIKLVYNKSDI